jgi:hypothetical protein
MSITYAWTCKFCEHGNAAGTSTCAVCRQAAIARPIDVDPPTERDTLAAARRRVEFEALPNAAKPIVTALWLVAVVAGLTAQFAWTMSATFIGAGIAVVSAIGAVAITKCYPPNAARGSSHDA